MGVLICFRVNSFVKWVDFFCSTVEAEVGGLAVTWEELMLTRSDFLVEFDYHL